MTETSRRAELHRLDALAAMMGRYVRRFSRFREAAPAAPPHVSRLLWRLTRDALAPSSLANNLPHVLAETARGVFDWRDRPAPPLPPGGAPRDRLFAGYEWENYAYTWPVVPGRTVRRLVRLGWAEVCDGVVVVTPAGFDALRRRRGFSPYRPGWATVFTRRRDQARGLRVRRSPPHLLRAADPGDEAEEAPPPPRKDPRRKGWSDRIRRRAAAARIPLTED
jgi:hypothetical protein